MGHVPVPWFIGGDAITPDKVARLVSYVASGGREGVLNPLDCRVMALQTPGQGVRITTGAYNVLNRTAPNESYTGMIDVEEQVGTTPTGTGAGRSDLVVFIVKDSNNPQEGWDEPADPANGPYIETEIITGVPANTTKWSQLGLLGSAIAVARIDFPPSTGTVTQGMIKDLRSQQGAQDNGGGDSGGDNNGTDPIGGAPTPQSASFVDVKPCTSNSVLAPPNVGTGTRYSSWIKWPAEAGWTIPFPAWATHASIFFSINPAINANTWGELRVNINNGQLITQAIQFDVNFPLEAASGGGKQPIQCTNSGGMRFDYTVGDTIGIPASLRGKNVPLKIEGRTIDDFVYTARGNSAAVRGCVLYLHVAFKQGASLS